MSIVSTKPDIDAYQIKLTSGSMLVGATNNRAVGIKITGDFTINGNGFASIGDGKITDIKISTLGISATKIVVDRGSVVMGGSGGKGLSTIVDGDIYVDSYKFYIKTGAVKPSHFADASISNIKLMTLTQSGLVSNTATTATSNNTANAIVARNAQGNFYANIVYANEIKGTFTGTIGSAVAKTGDTMTGSLHINPSTTSSCILLTGKKGFASQVITPEVTSEALKINYTSNNAINVNSGKFTVNGNDGSVYINGALNVPNSFGANLYSINCTTATITSLTVGTLKATQSQIAEDLEVKDPTILCGKDNPSDSMHCGLLAEYKTGITKYYGGIVRDASDTKWKFFRDSTTDFKASANLNLAASAVLRVSNIELNSSLDQIVFGNYATTGSALTTAISATLPSANRRYTIPDIGSDGNFLIVSGSLASNTILGTNATGKVTSYALTSTGQIIMGVTGSGPTAGTISGTTNRIDITTNVGSITLSTPQDIHTNASVTFATATCVASNNQLSLGSGVGKYIINVPGSTGSSRIFNFPDIGAGISSTFVMNTSNQSISGTKTFSDGIEITDGSNQLILNGGTNSSTTATINAVAPATASRVYTIPDAGSNASFILSRCSATQTIFSNLIIDSITTATRPVKVNASKQLISATIDLTSSSDVSGILPVASGGTGSSAALVANGIMYASASGTIVCSSALTDNQIMIGKTGSAPTLATLTAGTNITINNTSGVITISAVSGTSGSYDTMTLGATSSQLTLGTTKTITVNGAVPSASAVYTIPDVGTTSDFVMSAGSQTLTGAKTFNNGVNITAGSNQLVLNGGTNSTTTTTINAIAPATASRVYTIPDAGSNASFILSRCSATQTIYSNLIIDSITTATRPVKVNASKQLISATIDLTSSDDVTGILPVANGGTGSSSALTANGIMYVSTNSTMISSLAMTDGQILIGQTSGAPALGTLTAGTNISISNGANSITVASITNPNFTSATFSATSSQLVLGTTKTTTISATQPSASAVYTIPDVGLTGNFILSTGSQTLTGAKTFDSAISITAGSNQLVLNGGTNSTTTATINATAPATASRVYTIPDAGSNASFILSRCSATQTIYSNLIIDSITTATRPVKVNASKQLISATIDLTSSDDVTGILPVANGGTGSSSALVANSIMYVSTNSTMISSLAMTDGQILIGQTSGAPALGTLTAGTNISISNGANSITIASITNPNFTSATFSATTSQLVLGTTKTTTITATQPSASAVYTIPDVGLTGNFILSTGSQTLTGAKTFDSAINITTGSNQLVLNGGTNSTTTATINATAPATASRVYTIPDAGTDASFILSRCSATQTIYSNLVVDSITTASKPVKVDANKQLISATISLSNSNDIDTSSILPVTNGGTGASSALTANGIMYVSTSSTMVSSLAMSDGQFLIGKTGGAPALSTLTAGANITITNAANSITIAAGTSGSFNTLILGATSSQLTLGTTKTITINGAVPSASAVYTVPDVGTTSEFVMTAGSQTLTGAKTFNNGVNITAGSNQLVLNGGTNSTTTATINAVAPSTASRTYTIPDGGTDASFILSRCSATQTIYSNLIIDSITTATRPVKVNASKQLISATIDLTSSDDVTGILPVANGGTGSSSALVANGIIYVSTNSTMISSLAMTDGQILIGQTSGAPALGTLTAGTNISISNGANSISINTLTNPNFTSATFSATSSQMVLGTTKTTTITATQPSSSAVYTIPDVGLTGNFILSTGSQTLTGTKTFNSGINITAGSNQLVLNGGTNSTTTATINAVAPATASRVYTIPDCGTDASFILSRCSATQTIYSNLIIDSITTATRPVKVNASKQLISATIDLTSSDDVTGILPVANGGTGSSSALVANGIIYVSTNSTMISSLAMTDGQILIGQTSGAPALGTLTAGTNISISNGANSISINTLTNPNFTSATFSATSSQLVLGTTKTTTITATQPSASVVYTIPDVGLTGNFILSTGSQTLTGAKTFDSAINITTGSNQLVLNGGTNSTTTATINAVAPATASRVYTIPDAGTDASFILSRCSATQTIYSNLIVDSITTATRPVKVNENKQLISATINLASSSDVSGVLPVANGGTGASSALTANSIMYVSTASTMISSTAMNDGQLLIGKNGGAPALGTLTSGTNISISNGANSITIASITNPNFTSATFSATSSQLTLGVTNTITINAIQPSNSAIYSIPDVGTVGSFVMTEGSQLINGNKTYSGAIKQQVATSSATDNFTQKYINQITSATTSPSIIKSITLTGVDEAHGLVELYISGVTYDGSSTYYHGSTIVKYSIDRTAAGTYSYTELETITTTDNSPVFSINISDTTFQLQVASTTGTFKGMVYTTAYCPRGYNGTASWSIS